MMNLPVIRLIHSHKDPILLDVESRGVQTSFQIFVFLFFDLEMLSFEAPIQIIHVAMSFTAYAGSTSMLALMDDRNIFSNA
jgi:hypothetical protein